MNFWRFAEAAATTAEPLTGTYDPLLVALSITLSCLAGITALQIASHLEIASSPTARRWWLIAGAVAMGGGIWSMHFTAMLAYSLPVSMHYDLVITLASLIPAILGSGAALYCLTITQLKLGGAQLQLGALLMAIGIGTMHYSGMEAMKMPALLRYDFFYFVLSIVVAHVLAMIAITIRFVLRRNWSLPQVMASVIGGIIMGCAVAGMHYTAMYAASFYALPDAVDTSNDISHAAMAVAIGGFAFLILTTTLLVAWIDNLRELFKRRAGYH